jgi:hypothetical protein
VLTHDVKVTSDRLTHEYDALLVPAGCGYATRKVRTPGAETVILVTFDDDNVPAHRDLPSMSACLRMLFSVIGRNVSLGLPATVVVPGLRSRVTVVPVATPNAHQVPPVRFQ